MAYTDFQTLWEQRFIEVAMDHFDPVPTLVEGGRKAEFEEGTVISISIEMGEENPHDSGWFECVVTAVMSYRPGDSGDYVSTIWRQLEEALGEGVDGNSKLRDRLSSGRTQIPGGMGSITYDDGQESDNESKTFRFSAVLGILPIA